MTDDEAPPDPPSFYDPLSGMRARVSGLTWRQRLLLFVAFWVVVIGIIVAVAVHEM